MNIYRIAALERKAVLADDLEDVYDGLKKALDYLGNDYIGKTKNEVKKAIKKLEEIRPHLKYKDRPVLGKY